MERAKVLRSACLVMLAMLAIIGCSKHEEIVAQPTPVKVQVVAGSAAGGGLRYSANVAPDVQVELAFKVSGYIDEILQVRGADGRMRNVQDGDFIKKGTVLAHVRDNEYRDRVAEAQAGLTQAKAEYERTAKLYETKSASKADYDGAYARFNASQARYAQAAQSLSDCTLRAPMDGYVLRRAIEVGNLAGPGSLGFILADTRSVKVVFGVPDVLVGQMKMGDFQSVTTEAIPGAEFRGRITRVAPSADPNSRVFEVECTVPNPDNQLKVGMIAALQVSNSALPHPEILIPLNAIVRPVDDPQGYAVFVVEEQNGKQLAHVRKVELGEVAGNAIAVKEGLQGGERLIIRGATIVVDAQEVRVIP
jgi:multidrug efflux system membrane fusion protein